MILPERQWQKLGADLYTWKGKDYLVVVAYYSHWLVVIPQVLIDILHTWDPRHHCLRQWAIVPALRSEELCLGPGSTIFSTRPAAQDLDDEQSQDTWGCACLCSSRLIQNEHGTKVQSLQPVLKISHTLSPHLWEYCIRIQSISNNCPCHALCHL